MFFSSDQKETYLKNMKSFSLGSKHFFFSKKTFIKEKKKNFYFLEGFVLPKEKSLSPKEDLLSLIAKIEMEGEQKILKEILKSYEGNFSFFVLGKEDQKIWGLSYGKSIFYNERHISSHSGILISEVKSLEKTIISPEKRKEKESVLLKPQEKHPFIPMKKEKIFSPDCIFAQGRSMEIAAIAQIFFEKAIQKKIQVLPLSFYRKSSFEKNLILANIEENIVSQKKETKVIQPRVDTDTEGNLQYYIAQMQETLNILGIDTAAVEDFSVEKALSSFSLKKDKRRVFLGSNEFYPIVNLIAYSDRMLTGSLTTSYLLGELKHGPMAMMDCNVNAFAVIPFSKDIEKQMVSLKEIEARKAKVTVFSDKKGLEIVKNHNFESVLVEGPFIYNAWRLCYSLILKKVI